MSGLFEGKSAIRQMVDADKASASYVDKLRRGEKLTSDEATALARAKAQNPMAFALGTSNIGRRPSPNLNHGAKNPMPSVTMEKKIDPHSLIFREAEQSRMRQVEEMFPPGEGYTPIVAARGSNGLTILDGHNRAAVAKARGDMLDAVVIDDAVYQELLKRGLDEVDIAHAALEYAGQYEAASAIRQQFVGANWARTEKIASEVLDALE